MAKLPLAVQTSFVWKSERVRKILQKVSAQQITVGPSKVTHRLDRSFIYGEVSSTKDAWKWGMTMRNWGVLVHFSLSISIHAEWCRMTCLLLCCKIKEIKKHFPLLYLHFPFFDELNIAPFLYFALLYAMPAHHVLFAIEQSCPFDIVVLYCAPILVSHFHLEKDKEIFQTALYFTNRACDKWILIDLFMYLF